MGRCASWIRRCGRRRSGGGLGHRCLGAVAGLDSGRRRPRHRRRMALALSAVERSIAHASRGGVGCCRDARTRARLARGADRPPRKPRQRFGRRDALVSFGVALAYPSRLVRRPDASHRGPVQQSRPYQQRAASRRRSFAAGCSRSDGRRGVRPCADVGRPSPALRHPASPGAPHGSCDRAPRPGSRSYCRPESPSTPADAHANTATESPRRPGREGPAPELRRRSISFGTSRGDRTTGCPAACPGSAALRQPPVSSSAPRQERMSACTA
jgi:hypothetical protein